MNRRTLLLGTGTLGFLSVLRTSLAAPARRVIRRANRPMRRARPTDPSWPAEASWKKLNDSVAGQVLKVRSPLAVCVEAPESVTCTEVFRELKNPYYIGDEAGLTETLGWLDGWTSQPSAYAIAVRNRNDVVVAVNFARDNNLRLVVKGGGHSYQGTSNCADSLLIWTRKMDAITTHDAFVPKGCAGKVDAQPAVTVEAGALWMHVYDAVTTKAGRYVQGGGCGTVGVAGLIQSGGFGSFSKNYGNAAGGLLEAEIVTADGAVRIANPCTNPDLFWGIKGGGGGALGVVTRLTLRTHDLPEFFGAVNATIKATSDEAFRRLIERVIDFYDETLFNSHWGEQIAFRPGNALSIKMVFQGLDQRQAEDAWRPLIDWVNGSPKEFAFVSTPRIIAVPARKFWDYRFLKKVPGVVVADDRPGAPESNVFWEGDGQEAGQFLYGYQSAWLLARLLQKDQRASLCDAIFAATRQWEVALHFNKGLAGAPAAAVAEAQHTAMNPAALDAFALAIIAGGGQPSHPGIPGHEPDLVTARKRADRINGAMTELRKVVPNAGSYVAESNFFEDSWQRSFWGANYPRLLDVKNKYDPDGLFFVHHGVGSERWSADGFTRLA